MIYLIITIGIIIFIALIVIAFTGKFLFNKLSVNFFEFRSPLIVERAYRAVDLRSRIEYTDRDHYMNYPHLHVPNIGERLIHDDGHLQRVINENIIDLAKTMIQDGFVEIKNETDPYNPFRHIVEMRVKVYKPES
ncbi:MAG TPA: hypothetical protein VFZ33_16925 [Chitinophagaceae bacterium]